MKAIALRIILTIFCFLLLIQGQNNFATTPEPSGESIPGTASGRLKVNVQTFKMKYAYAKRQSEGAEYLILLTNRPFPLDLSKIVRFELNKYAVRYDLQGVAFGVDKNQQLVFIDILREPKMISSSEFQIEPEKEGSIAGRVYTNGEIRYFRNKVEFDLQFNAKVEP